MKASKEKEKNLKINEVGKNKDKWVHVECLYWAEELNEFAPKNWMKRVKTSKAKGEILEINVGRDLKPHYRSARCCICTVKGRIVVKCNVES